MLHSARNWLNLTQICVCTAWLACSSQLPLEIDTDPPKVGRGRLPTEFAGQGGFIGPSQAVCGDSIITAPIEACDRTNLNGATCLSLGYAGGGVLLCNPTSCHYDTIMCRMSTGMRPPVVPPPPIGPPPPGVPPPTKPPPPNGFDDAGAEDAGS